MATKITKEQARLAVAQLRADLFLRSMGWITLAPSGACRELLHDALLEVKDRLQYMDLLTADAIDAWETAVTVAAIRKARTLAGENVNVA